MKNFKTIWPNTAVTELLKITLPLIQAPMAGGATTPELVATVSNAGGLGSLAAGYMTPSELYAAIEQIRKLTDKPFAVNLFIPEEHHATNEQIERAREAVQTSCRELNFNVSSIKSPYAPSFDEQMDVILEKQVPIFSFTFGVPPDNWIEKFKKNGIRLIGTATTLEEARLLEDCETDAVIAQGSEAGGHRATFLRKTEDTLNSMSTLVSTLVESIKVPIIAAGGIMDAREIISSLNLGASAVQMGTAFLCCTESGIHPCYKEALLNTKVDNTTLTRAFSGKLARGIINKFIVRMQQHENDILDYPIQNALTRPMRKESEKQNCIDYMSMWAGQAVFMCKGLPVGELIQELNNQVILLLNAREVL